MITGLNQNRARVNKWDSEIHERLKNCTGWQFDAEKNEIYRNYEFKTPT